MKRKNFIKKALSSFICAAIALIPTGVFADSNTTKSIPVYLSVEVPVLDYSVTESISMEFETDQGGNPINVPDLEVTDIVVTNNADLGALNLVSLSATAQTGWSIVADTTDFVNQAASAKSFSLVADTQDLSKSAYTFSNVQIDSGDDLTITMSGKTGPTNQAYSSQAVATCVLTVSLY